VLYDDHFYLTFVVLFVMVYAPIRSNKVSTKVAKSFTLDFVSQMHHVCN
jgi:hypothetical protein